MSTITLHTDETNINTLDLSKITALQQKRTLAFVNHFVTSTVQFLNNFMKNCEFKLIQFERKLEKVEAAMVLLETRLSSVPVVNDIEEKIVEVKSQDKSEISQEKSEISQEKSEIKCDVSVETNEETSNEANIPNSDILDRSEYAKFIKMVQVGVPLEAVKLKVILEGLDPNTLASFIK